MTAYLNNLATLAAVVFLLAATVAAWRDAQGALTLAACIQWAAAAGILAALAAGIALRAVT